MAANRMNSPDRSLLKPGGSRSAGPDTGAAISLGFVVDEAEPGRAVALCEIVRNSVPAGVKVEFLVLDDHTNPKRRELVDVVDHYGDAVRLVPTPGEARSVVLDALSQCSGSDFIVVPLGEEVPWNSMAAVVRELRADGADVVAVGGLGTEPTSVAGGSDLDSGLARRLGLPGADGEDGSGDRAGLVLIRRWVARWLFSDVPSDADVAGELEDRARLLELRLLLLDESGTPHPRP